MKQDNDSVKTENDYNRCSQLIWLVKQNSRAIFHVKIPPLNLSLLKNIWVPLSSIAFNWWQMFPKLFLPLSLTHTHHTQMITQTIIPLLEALWNDLGSNTALPLNGYEILRIFIMSVSLWNESRLKTYIAFNVPSDWLVVCI